MGQAVSRRAEAIAPRAGELVGGPRVLKSLQALSSLPVMGGGARQQGEGTPHDPLAHVLCPTTGAHPLRRRLLPSGTWAAVPAQGDPPTVARVPPPSSPAVEAWGPVASVPAEASTAARADLPRPLLTAAATSTLVS